VGVASGETPEIATGAMSTRSPFSLGVSISTTQPIRLTTPPRAGAMGAATRSECSLPIRNPAPASAASAQQAMTPPLRLNRQATA
jgi:hypothetical protein